MEKKQIQNQICFCQLNQLRVKKAACDCVAVNRYRVTLQKAIWVQINTMWLADWFCSLSISDLKKNPHSCGIQLLISHETKVLCSRSVFLSLFQGLFEVYQNST